MSDTFTLSVPDMSCGHCRASITAALEPLGGAAVFDMDSRQVTVSGPLEPAAAIAALDRIGFPAAPAPA
ncbi:MAG: heavy-metal-associated domain-containing protein [Rhodobacter sp.]|nr:heavy-metal-associated domain-containing protein [Paracoccaceae bacterium]MCC0073657.1 heavy-metal-associated domain-containing protein [Rhodobacter sp.]